MTSPLALTLALLPWLLTFGPEDMSDNNVVLGFWLLDRNLKAQFPRSTGCFTHILAFFFHKLKRLRLACAPTSNVSRQRHPFCHTMTFPEGHWAFVKAGSQEEGRRKKKQTNNKKCWLKLSRKASTVILLMVLIEASSSPSHSSWTEHNKYVFN